MDAKTGSYMLRFYVDPATPFFPLRVTLRPMTTSAVSRLFLRFLKNLRSTAELRRHRDRRRLASQALVFDPEEVEAEFIARAKYLPI